MIQPYVHVPYHQIDDYLKFLKENRINLELYFSSRTLDTINTSDILRLLERIGYNPSFTVHAPFMDLSPGAVDSKIRSVTIERFSHILKIAEYLKAKTVVFHSGYEKWKYALKIDEWLEKSLLTWNVLLPRAIENGSKLAIENIFEDEPTNLRVLMQEIGSEHFGICFDTGHCNLFSKTSLDQWLQELTPYIIELHLHDNNRTADDHVAIGEGVFDFNALFSALKERDLVYTIEGHTPQDVLKSIQRLKDYL